MPFIHPQASIHCYIWDAMQNEIVALIRVSALLRPRPNVYMPSQLWLQAYLPTKPLITQPLCNPQQVHTVFLICYTSNGVTLFMEFTISVVPHMGRFMGKHP